jgi:hypothetical protein
MLASRRASRQDRRIGLRDSGPDIEGEQGVIKLPEVVALVLCERMDVDPQVGKTSLSGIFHARRFRSFPSPVQTFTVYVAPYGGIGEGTVQLDILRLEPELRIYRWRKWSTFPGAAYLVNLVIRVGDCVFPAPGRYELSLRYDDRLLTYRRIDIFHASGDQ